MREQKPGQQEGERSKPSGKEERGSDQRRDISREERDRTEGRDKPPGNKRSENSPWLGGG